jgi:hypothetical protein
MELMQSISGTKDIEKTNIDCSEVAEQSNYDKVIDFSYHQSPTCSPSLGHLMLKSEVYAEKNDEMEIKTAECIFNFEDIFENDEIERKERENESEECKETNFLLTKPVMIENTQVFFEEKSFSEGMKEKEIEDVQSESGLAKYESKIERKASNKQEENKNRRSSGKKNRRGKGRKLNEERTKAEKENNDVKEEFLDNENKDLNDNLPILKSTGPCFQVF